MLHLQNAQHNVEILRGVQKPQRGQRACATMKRLLLLLLLQERGETRGQNVSAGQAAQRQA
jgi:hypothetical protein